VQITNTRTHVSRVISVGVDGRFSVAVPPGTYALLGRSPYYEGGSAFDCQALTLAVVMSHRTTSSSVFCQES
jgi:hypothetical protein